MSAPLSIEDLLRTYSPAVLRSELERRRREDREAELARDADQIRERCKNLRGFVKEAWHVIEPSAPFVPGWHTDAICDHLQAITEGRLDPRLLINVPPGTSKSTLVSVMWQAWEWGPAGLPSMRYLCTAHNDEPTKRDARKCRNLVRSEWYQKLWPHVRLVRAGETSFENDQTGTRETSAFTSLTSQRGDRFLVDDPHSAADSVDVITKATMDFREGGTNRLNDQVRSAIVAIMQRLHEQDLSGVILSLGLGYVHLCLPMEFEPKRRCVTPIFTDPRKFDGELLDPRRFPKSAVDELKKAQTGYSYAGQYQQRPTAREGGMFKRHWFKVVDAVPSEAAARCVRGWDLAATIEEPGKAPAYTAGVKLSFHDGKFYIEDVQRFRETARKVRLAISNNATLDGVGTYVVIPQDPGQAGKDQAESIIAENAGFKISAERVGPDLGSKARRAEPFAAQLEAGNVYLVRGAWNAAYIEELCAFGPGGSYADQVDATATAFNKLANLKTLMVFSEEAIRELERGG